MHFSSFLAGAISLTVALAAPPPFEDNALVGKRGVGAGACATYCIIWIEDPPVFAACVIGCAATGVPETDGLKPKTLENGTIVFE
ncbi:hypothetical protein AC579_7149 [Pseudocercospora musae]|uniref:Uncharacterized protein n=1 Tax=Pseudocercospora musae TaxID=113226 RepID=A0A139IMV0_9PEZI|nr:hypothetical protein AC579_7149 [Pseudocercospora musae]